MIELLNSKQKYLNLKKNFNFIIRLLVFVKMVNIIMGLFV